MRPGDCQANPGYRKSPLKPVAFKASTTSLRMPRHVLATLMSDTLPSHHCTVDSSSVAIVSVLFFEVSAAVKLETKTDQLDVGLIVCAKRDKVDAFTPVIRVRKVKLTHGYIENQLNANVEQMHAGLRSQRAKTVQSCFYP